MRTLERAAVMVALMLLVRERVAVAEQRALGDLIGGLLKHPQAEPATLARGARRHGLALDGPLAVIVARGREPDPQTVQAVRAALGDGCLAGPFDGDLVAITAAAGAAKAAERLHAALAPPTPAGRAHPASGASAAARTPGVPHPHDAAPPPSPSRSRTAAPSCRRRSGAPTRRLSCCWRSAAAARSRPRRRSRPTHCC